MYFCSNCGNKVENNSSFCTECGMNLTNNMNSYQQVNNNYNGNNMVKNESSGMKIASIVLGILGIFGAVLFIFAPFSLILSIIGLILGIVATKKCKNVAGIVLNSIGLFLSLIICLIIGIFIYFVFISVEDTYENYGDYDIPSIYYDDSYYFG